MIKKILNKLLDTANVYYSQEGEDILLKRLFINDGYKGFYVDIGAHHPTRFSNTYAFYLKGWCGINVEPNPDTFKLFTKKRPNDINLNLGVAQKSSLLKYYMFDEPALNTFDEEMLESRLKKTSYKHIKTIKVEVTPLSKIFDSYILQNQQIDFLTIDVEGYDLDVLKSNDWLKYRPKWILVEELNLLDIESLDFPIHYYMKSLNYILFAKTFNTLYYKNGDL